MDKFKGKGSNAFIKAQEEVSKNKVSATPVNTGDAIPRRKRERKEQMSIMLTPTHKVQARELADELDMSVSELFGHWIDQNRKQSKT